MDYFVIEGHREAAETFSAETGLQPEVDLASMQARIHTGEALRRGDVVGAIESVNELNPEVRGMRACLRAQWPGPPAPQRKDESTTFHAPRRNARQSLCGNCLPTNLKVLIAAHLPGDALGERHPGGLSDADQTDPRYEPAALLPPSAAARGGTAA